MVWKNLKQIFRSLTTIGMKEKKENLDLEKTNREEEKEKQRKVLKEFQNKESLENDVYQKKSLLKF